MLGDSKKTGFLMSFGGGLLASYIRLVYRTSRIVQTVEDATQKIQVNDPVIMAMWHGQFMMLPPLKPEGVPVKIMVARHNDAEWIGQALLRFDMDLVRGAGAGDRKKDRGGATALRTSLRALEEGSSVALTADVPPGPARVCGKGIVTMARHSGRPIVPVAVATSRSISLNTWSRFTINLPFSRLAFVVGDPVYVPEDADEEACEQARLAVEEAMNDVTRRAYELAGADPIPATPTNALPDGVKLSGGRSLMFYKFLMRAARPLVPYILRKRAKKGKEDLNRQNERLGQPKVERPFGPMIWFHAASVGEMNAILPLMHKIRDLRPDLSQLLTTGTVTSATLAMKKAPEGVIHQYAPVDSPSCVRGFLEHWKPDAAFFVESEIWPNLLLQTSETGVPLILLNGIISDKSFKRWKKRGTMARAIFSRYNIVLLQNKIMAKRFMKLGARKVSVVGNLKMDAPCLPVHEDEMVRFKEMVGTRKVFLAASTHPGEEMMVGRAHLDLKERSPDLLTVIVPRHPERGEEVAEELRALGLSVARRALGEEVRGETDVYVADTIGELGLFYSVGRVVFIGGSLVKHGGQNPIEAIKLGAGVITGPHWFNQSDSYRELFRLNGAREVLSAETLASVVDDLFYSEGKLENMMANAEDAVRNLSGALEKTLNAIAPYLPEEPDDGQRRSSIRRVS